jgi:hypothetical protein
LSIVAAAAHVDGGVVATSAAVDGGVVAAAAGVDDAAAACWAIVSATSHFKCVGEGGEEGDEEGNGCCLI